jgi:integrase
MAVVKRKRVGGVVYWISFTWNGKRVWERAGKDRREAERLESRRLSEVRAGTYQPEGQRRATTFKQWGEGWAERRNNRSAADDVSRLDRFVFTRPWLADLPIADLRPRHIVRLVEELKATTSDATEAVLSPKTVANIYGTVRTLVRDARTAEVLLVDPCVLPRGTFRRKGGKPRDVYSTDEIRTLCFDDRISIRTRVWNAVAFLTGCRQGEVCGLRWRDWDARTEPLGCLTVERQYEGRLLKTEHAEGEQTRQVPVHPALAKLLTWWKVEGFELVFCRKPTPDDPIIPSRDGTPHTKSTAYKAWRHACAKTGVPNKTLHSSRHTFITLCRRGGARKEVLEKVTHNARGDIVDAYTHWDWAPLCEAVLCLQMCDANVDRVSQVRGIIVEAPGIEPIRWHLGRGRPSRVDRGFGSRSSRIRDAGSLRDSGRERSVSAAV